MVALALAAALAVSKAELVVKAIIVRKEVGQVAAVRSDS